MMEPTKTTTAFAPAGRQDKRGALCCGCCCDMRRAVIIVNILSIVFALLSIPVIISTITVWNEAMEEFLAGTDDVVSQIDESIQQYHTRMIAEVCVSIFAAICGIVGAVKFLPWLVYVPILWHVVSVVLAWVFSIQLARQYQALGVGIPYLYLIASTVAKALFIYPHVGFVKEVHEGTMTKDRYMIHEQASCCCV